MARVCLLAGPALIVLGVAGWSWQAALICAGVYVWALGYVWASRA